VIAPVSAAAGGQYHLETSQKRGGSAISVVLVKSVIPRRGGETVSPSFPFSIVQQIGWENSSEKRGDIETEFRAILSRDSLDALTVAQYQPRRGRFWLLIGVGVALAVLYVVFLGVWYWATRVRPRAIDTTRRIL
jgi:hypothetical protein